MSKLTNNPGTRRVQRYVARLFEISVCLAILPLIVHGLATVNGLPVA